MIFLSNSFSIAVAETASIEQNIYYQAMQESSSSTTNKEIDQQKKVQKIIDEILPIEVVEQVSIATFHNQEKSVNELSVSICSQCHNQWPHEKNARSRTLLNMHNKILSCESCHFALSQKKESLFELNYLDVLDNNSMIVPRYKG